MLATCAACFKVKMSCKTGDNGTTGRNEAKTLARTSREGSTAGDMESEDEKEDGGAAGEGPVVEAMCGQEGGRATQQVAVTVKKKLEKYCV